MNERTLNFQEIQITSALALSKCESEKRPYENYVEFLPWANNTAYKELAENVIPDRKGPWQTPLFLICSTHKTDLGMKNLCKKADSFISTIPGAKEIEKLSISACIMGDKIQLVVLLRAYGEKPNFAGFFDYVGDNIEKDPIERKPIVTGKLIVPDIPDYTAEEREEHKRKYSIQKEKYLQASEKLPFLNSIDTYVPKSLPDKLEQEELIYDLESTDKQIQLVGSYEEFTRVFREMKSFVSGVEYYNYVSVMKGEASESAFMDFLKEYLETEYVSTGQLYREDSPVMMKRLYRALFQLDIIQDLIDDPKITDIKITAYNCIRCRINGKAYITNITFVDEKDYWRFVKGIALRNNISLNTPNQTFTDKGDERYIMRFSSIAPYVTADNCPVLHIRKVNRNKLTSDDLIKAGMMDEKLRDYLLDCGRTSRGVVFAGPPGCGKTVILNWFLEDAYEQSAEILVIQENDELFCSKRKGVIFEHVVNNPINDEEPVNLEELGQLALVAGANVFIIGEAKGGEICSAITLSNSGCRTAITIHSPSSTETIDKMADLAQRGYAKDYNQAKRMLKSFQTIVYMQDFKIQEISEIIGYDEEKNDMVYRYIYRRDAEKSKNL